MLKKNIEKQERNARRLPTIPYTKVGKSKKDILKQKANREKQKGYQD